MSDQTPLKSASQCLRKSPVQCEFLSPPPSASTYQMIHGVIPVCGFGTMNGFDNTFSNGGQYVWVGSALGLLTFDSVWPAIYNQLYETWTDSGGTGSYTSVCSQDTDILVTVTQGSGPSTPNINSSTVFTVTGTGTTLSISYTDTNGQPGTYTATVSGDMLGGTGPFNPVTGWATLTAQAHTLCAGGNYTGLSGSERMYYNTSTGVQYFDLELWFCLAAAYGMAGLANYPQSWPSGATKHAANIADWPNILPQPGNQIALNGGFCFCSQSVWLLNGAYPYVGQGGINPNLNTNTNNHLNLYHEKISSGLAISALSQPRPFVANGTSYSNPVMVGTVATFLDTDAIASMNGGGTFGLLGFRSVDA